MHLILTGGFLGAGKTTLITQACKYLKKQGVKTAAVGNDQGKDLVDTAYLQYHGISTDQVTGGCFCCNFSALESSLELFKITTAPDIVFAESVGSCTDLVATVLKPLQRLHPDITLTLTVLADACVLFRQLKTGQFIYKNNVQYIYDLQLDEADIIIITKSDLLPQYDSLQLKRILQKKYPSKKILTQDNFIEIDVAKWLQVVESCHPEERLSLTIDYKKYGEGEAELAWLDAIVQLDGESAKKGAGLFIERFRRHIEGQNWTIGHLKFLLKVGDTETKISFTSSDTDVSNDIILPESRCARLLVNARIQCEPEELRLGFEKIVKQVKEELTCKIIVSELNSFKPGFPKPTHRIQ